MSRHPILFVDPTALRAALPILSVATSLRRAHDLGAIRVGRMLAIPVARIREVYGPEVADAAVAAQVTR
jgi:hypothetical protein